MILTNLGHKFGHEFDHLDVELGQSQYKLGHKIGQSDVELGQSQSDVELAFGQSDVELGQSHSDVELELAFGQSYVELGQSQSDVELSPKLELGQSDVKLGQSQSDVELGRKFGRLNIELGQSDIKSTLTDEPSGILNEPSAVEPSAVEPPDNHLILCSGPIPNVADYSSFCPETNTYPTIKLDNLGYGDTYKKLRIDPVNNLSVTAAFNLNTGLGSILYVCSTVTSIDDERGIVSIDLEENENLDDAANYCAITGL